VKELDLVVVRMHREVVSILQANPTGNIWDFATNNDISIPWPIGIRHNHVGGTAVEQPAATLTFHVDKPLLKSVHVNIFILELLIKRVCGAAHHQQFRSVFFLRSISLSISPELSFSKESKMG
jgi:hypothetical protein